MYYIMGQSWTLFVYFFTFHKTNLQKKTVDLGGRLGLVVNGKDSVSEGRGFESRHLILDGHVSHIFVVKIVIIVLKDRK